MYLLAVGYELRYGDRVVLATTGTFVYLARGTPARHQNCGDTPGKFLYIAPSGEFEKLIAKTSAATAQGQSDMQ